MFEADENWTLIFKSKYNQFTVASKVQSKLERTKFYPLFLVDQVVEIFLG